LAVVEPAGMLPRSWPKSDPLASHRPGSRLISCANGTVNRTTVEPLGPEVVIFVLSMYLRRRVAPDGDEAGSGPRCLRRACLLPATWDDRGQDAYHREGGGAPP
jgi:hypothetical protein